MSATGEKQRIEATSGADAGPADVAAGAGVVEPAVTRSDGDARPLPAVEPIENIVFNVAVAGEAVLPVPPARDPTHAGQVAIANLLRWGVGAAGLLLALALAGSLLSGVPLGSQLLPAGELFGGGHALPPVLGQLGLVALAVTPLARVALAAGVFARAGERRQTWVSLGVLALLAVALLLGAGGG